LTNKAILFVEDGNHGGNRPRQHEFVDHGVHFIRPPDLKDGRVDFKNADHINETAFKRVRKGIGKAGDIILTHRATVGRIAITEVDDPPVFVTNPGTTVWRSLDDDILDQQYLYCYMRSPAFMAQLWANVGNNCTFDYVSLTQQRTLLVAFPNIDQQRIIADYLRSIDKKIEINRQINQTLEEMAQAIFKSWFVDFEPVKAKIEAKATGQDPERAAMCTISGKSDAELDQLHNTAALFPDELTNSEIGPIPAGWNERRIDSILELAYGKALKKTNRIPGHVPVYGSGGVNGFHNKHLVEGPGIIVGRKGTVGSLHWENDDFFPIDTVFYVAPKGDFSLEYIFYLLQTLGLQNMNTDAAVPGLNRNNVYSLLVAGHPKKLVEIFSNVVRSFSNKMSQIKKENESLVVIRDTLLPKLLSREITVKGAESVIKEGI
jgi:type I restriction enzyme S subunit